MGSPGLVRGPSPNMGGQMVENLGGLPMPVTVAAVKMYVYWDPLLEIWSWSWWLTGILGGGGFPPSYNQRRGGKTEVQAEQIEAGIPGFKNAKISTGERKTLFWIVTLCWFIKLHKKLWKGTTRYVIWPKGSFTIDFSHLNGLPTVPFDGIALISASYKEAGEIVKLDQHLQAWIWAAVFLFLENADHFVNRAMKKGPLVVCLGYIGDCTGDDATQLCGHYNKPL